MDTSTIFDRTIATLRRALSGASIRSQSVFSEDNLDNMRIRIDECLEQRGGEVSARLRATEIGKLYLSLNSSGRLRFNKLLVEEYGIDSENVNKNITFLQTSKNCSERRKYELALRNALVPRRLSLLRQFNGLSEGVKFLVDMRADVLELDNINGEMDALDTDLRDLLTSWFDVGFLDLRRICWQSPAALLEKLISYEAVHAIQSWGDLKNRLDSDRRCFAFFHPRMPEEPLIFVEVALVKGMADNIQYLLDETAPSQDLLAVDSAIFYSISNCQKGLKGISFGNFLIKRVVDELRSEIPHLKYFATLSPIPGFVSWLAGIKSDSEFPFLQGDDAELVKIAGQTDSTISSILTLLRKGEWYESEGILPALEATLLSACVKYLTFIKEDGTALDRVAHFHLSNGAQLDRINWLADTSKNGLQTSAGMMVNYLYQLPSIERNHEDYTSKGIVALGSSVRRLLKR